MPCYNPMNDMSAEELQAFVLKQELNRVTDLLCRLCESTESIGQDLPDDHKKWWENHKVEDAKRKGSK